MSWHRESRRHSMASRGIKTAQKLPMLPQNVQTKNNLDFDPIFKKWFDKILERDLEWFRRVRDEYKRIQKDYPKPKSEYVQTKEEREAQHLAWKKSKIFIRKFPLWVDDSIRWGFKAEEKAEKHIRKELERKKENLIAKVKKKVGTIQEVEVRLNPKGGLDGRVKGTDGSVSIETIGAGGYNIQRYHFRTLIKDR